MRRGGYSLHWPLSRLSADFAGGLAVRFASELNSKLFGGFPCFVSIQEYRCTLDTGHCIVDVLCTSPTALEENHTNKGKQICCWSNDAQLRWALLL